MSADRLRILYVTQLPPSPPRFGAQARMHGLMAALGKRHALTAVSLVDENFVPEESRRAMQAYCDEVVLVPNPAPTSGSGKRLLQLRSLASRHSFERRLWSVPGLQSAIDAAHARTRFDLVNLEFPYLGHLRLAPSGSAAPPVFVDSHEIAHQLARQIGRQQGGALRYLYGELNWRKLRREELGAYRRAEGVYFCSKADEERARALVPMRRTAVVPNAADVEHLRPRSDDPPPDGETLLFFGLLSTQPNVDGILWFAREVWPRIVARRPGARLKIVGKAPPDPVRALAGPKVEVAGLVEDLRPHLAAAAALIVPLRVGGGTRLKIVEGMAMGKAIISTRLGAEGLEVASGKELLLADSPEEFAAGALRLLEEPNLSRAMGETARRVAVERYSWEGASRTLESFFRQAVGAADASSARAAGGAR